MPHLYSQIKQNLDHSPWVKKFDQALQNTGRQVIHHLNPSSMSLLAVRAWDISKKNVLVVSQDDILAEDIWDDLLVLAGRDSALYLPDYETLAYEERSPHYSIRAARIETLIRSLNPDPKLYSLSVRSLLRWISPRENLSKHLIQLACGLDYAPEKLVRDLADLGYEVDYQVSKVFQCARRGGIVDVFSPPHHKPIRLEFFGDEIISIRQFSLATQRSEPTPIEAVTLIPAREIAISDISKGSVIYSRIRDHGYFEGIESYISLLLSDVQTFADYFAPDELIIIWNNFPYLKDEMEETFEQAYNHFSKIHSGTGARKTPRPEQIFAPQDQLIRLATSPKSIFLSQSEFASTESSFGFTLPESIRSPFSPIGGYDGDIQKLATDLNSLRKQSFEVIILYDNESQSHRMNQLLDDYEVISRSFIGVLHEGFRQDDARLALYTDHEIFNRYKRKRYSPRFSAGEQITDYESLKPGDYVVHIDHGIGVFEGMKIITLDRREIECLTIRYAGEDRIYVPTFQLQLVSKYIAEEGANPVLNKLGSSKWNNTKRKAKEQIELIAADIVALYAERSKRKGIAHQADTPWQKELEDSFIYEDTPDQIKSIREIKEDLELPAPMERLLCGDVGFGKTEVAIRAAFKVCLSGFQVAVLVPTTLLAEQHYRVFKERLAQYPIRIAMFSRFRSSAQIRKDLASLNRGEIDIAIGTHRIISKDVKFKQLGLLVIDEEHRFGVRHKEKLRKFQSNVDTLYMSATPIPRTLNMALAKLKEISLIQTSPKERLPIRTIITPRDIEVIKDAIRREVDRGGQVFFLHNRVQTIETVAAELRDAMPGIRFIVGHAQLTEHHLERVMDAFLEHEYDVLISTTIIENGIDIPNANTIIIDRADTFGLAQLYQMRGRVGRSNRRAYAYLLIPKGITSEAKHRLDALAQYDFLGAGFQVALRDLEIRGAGAILGVKQSGVIQNIGFNYYNHLLEKAIEAVQTNQPELFLKDDFPEARQALKTEIDLYFPSGYIADDEERLRIYRRLNELETLAGIDEFQTELSDRFGSIPEKAIWLMLYFKLNILTRKANIQNTHVRSGKLVIDFKTEALPSKEQVLKFCSQIPEQFKIDGSKGIRITIDLSSLNGYLEQFKRAISLLEVYTTKCL